MSGWSILFWLIVSFLLMYPLKRWITAHVQGVAFLLTGNPRVAMWLFWVLFLPGTLLHELSHWLTAFLLGVKTGRFSLWPQMKKGGELQMGSVQVELSDPFRHSLIGLAPLIFGTLAVLLIGQGLLNLGRLGTAFNSGDVEQIIEAVARLLLVPDVWLWLYLIFAISNAMLPSASDRESWRTVLIYLGLTLGLALGLGLNPTMPPELQNFGLTLMAYLLSAFVITIVIDIFFILLIAGTETVFTWMLGRQVQYNR
ncbi:MAG: hypothetical protein Fur0044_49410 [Anaerolineae bacterium]|nr:hypothetical protein [Anaerolineales bacterium]MCQ3977747.1 hypothetical protein [Anaerolineae bacterium]